MDWYQIKIALSVATGISQDAMHVIVGVAFQLLLAAVLRIRISHWLPWLVVFALAALNEWSDLNLEIWPNRAEQWGETLKDLAVTMALPTLLMALSRWAPRLFARVETPPAAKEA